MMFTEMHQPKKNRFKMTEECRDEQGPQTKPIRRGNVESPDGGRGWVVVFSAFILNMIAAGCSSSFGALYVIILDYFQESSSTEWIELKCYAVPWLCGPIASVVTNRVGLRKATIIGGLITAIGFISSMFVQSVDAMAVTCGFIAGLGISITYLNSIVVVAMYFEKKRTLATGISRCGNGIGHIISVPLCKYLILSYSWRDVVLIIGAISSIAIVVCGAVFKPLEVAHEHIEVQDSDCEDKIFKKQDQGIYADNELTPTERDFLVSTSIKSKDIYKSNPVSCHDIRKTTKTPCKRINKPLIDISIFKNSLFVLFALSNISLHFWYYVPFVFNAIRAKILGFTDKEVMHMVAMIGISHTLGKLPYGFLGDRKQINRLYLYSGSLLLAGAVLAVVPLFTTFLPCIILAGLFGLFSVSAEILTSAIIADILGIDKLTDAYGFVMFLQGVSFVVGKPAVGWLYDMTGSYGKTFCSAGSCIGITGIIVFLTALRKQREKTHKTD